jgi:hypothetical protein
MKVMQVGFIDFVMEARSVRAQVRLGSRSRDPHMSSHPPYITTLRQPHRLASPSKNQHDHSSYRHSVTRS